MPFYINNQKVSSPAQLTTVPVLESDPKRGLTSDEAAYRAQSGLLNISVDPPSRTVGQIIKDNVLTYFNLVFAILAAAVIMVGRFKELTFLPVVIINAVIGIVQEVRSKKTLDKLTLLSAPRSKVVRNGELIGIQTDQLVRDDIVLFSTGSQICADAVVVSGGVQVNEALITGEADEISKGPGDELMSGSFVVSGNCRARLTKVGAESFVSKLTIEARRGKKPKKTGMMKSLTRIVQVIGILLIPMGALLFINQYRTLKLSLADSIVKTIGALVGMIPEGLYLLTSIALAVSVMRLARRRTLVHNLGCIETLARVDVLCVDKTGTITEDKMLVQSTELLCPDRFCQEDVDGLLTDFAAAHSPENATMSALKAYYKGAVTNIAKSILPFSSTVKFSGVSFDGECTYLLGAPEFILGSEYEKYKSRIEPFSSEGYRVLLLAMYDGMLKQGEKPADAFPIALVMLYNKIRPNAPATFEYFAKQGVAIKVISGDNPQTVSEVARRAGIQGSEKYIDAQTLDTEEKLNRAADEYTVFGRVTPAQKRILIRGLKASGHTVAMTGDGVNDVLALKDADCSIAMASGSDVSARVSHLVLLDSDFSALPDVVAEGRRVIGNIERSASLFLVKNTFSFLMTLTAIIFVFAYPITPTQISILSALTIGIPTFFLALEPNKERIKGSFMRNVLHKALPGGFTNYLLVLFAVLYCQLFQIPDDQTGTMAIILMLVVGMIMLFRISTPMTLYRKIVFIGSIVLTLLAVPIAGRFFDLHALGKPAFALIVVFFLLTWPVNDAFTKALDFIGKKLNIFIKNRDAYMEKKRAYKTTGGKK